MSDVPVFYATTEGQTERIARRIAEELRAHGLSSEAIDMRSPSAHQINWDVVRGVIVGASLHGGRHQRAAADFVRRHRDRLNARPSWFFSVSLGIASKSQSEVEAVQKIARDFVNAAQWSPREVVCVAGRLAYTQYNWFMRLMMRRIARKEGGSTDTSRDHEYTDWSAIGAFARRCAGDIHRLSISSAAMSTVRETVAANSPLTRSF